MQTPKQIFLVNISGRCFWQRQLAAQPLAPTAPPAIAKGIAVLILAIAFLGQPLLVLTVNVLNAPAGTFGFVASVFEVC